MRTLRLGPVVVVCFAAACGFFSAAGCGSNGSGGGGAGGASAGGAPGTGGKTSTGGAPGAGGAAGTTSTSTGGSAGTPGTGGMPSGAGGAAGAGDAGTSDGPRADAGGGSDAGGKGDAGSDAGAGYSPCPTNGSACIVMPLGDSITDGFPFENGGYRVELFTQAVTMMTPITFVGRNMNGPTTVANMPFPRGHEGYSGFTIDTDASHSGIQPLVDAAIAMFHPHIILLHIGTNDINGNVNIAQSPTRLAALLDQIIADAPNALLVVAQIIPSQTDATNTRLSSYNAAMPALVQQRAAAGKHIALVDMYSVFTANANYKTALLTDNLHPNVTGYATMGDAWYNAIKSVLPKH